MSQAYEICIACGNHTGKAGAGEDSIYVGDNCGLGPLCEECYHDIKSSFARQLEEEQALPWLPAPDGPGWWWHDHETHIEPDIHFFVRESDGRLGTTTRNRVHYFTEYMDGRFQRVQPPKGDAK